MKNFFAAIAAWMIAHPVVEHFLLGVLAVGGTAAVGYLNTPATSHDFKGWALAGVSLVAAAMWSYIQANKSTLISYILSQMNVGPNTTPQNMPPVAMKMMARMKRLGLWLLLTLGFSLFASSAFCQWSVPGSSFDKNYGLSLKDTAPSIAPGNYIVGMPSDFIGMNVGNPVTVYGIGFSYTVMICGVNQSANPGQANLTPFLGIEGSFFFDCGDWWMNKQQKPIFLRAGLGLIGPEIGFATPAIDYLWSIDGSKGGAALFELKGPLPVLETLLTPFAKL